MVEFGTQETLTLEANADLSNKQYHFLRYVATEKCDQASHNASDALVGVLQNKPQSSEFATVAVFGLSKLVAGAAITAGNLLTTNGSGRAVSAAPASGSTVYIAGRALSAAGADGDVITALVFPTQKLSGTP
jgi:hypothetical protein